MDAHTSTNGSWRAPAAAAILVGAAFAAAHLMAAAHVRAAERTHARDGSRQLEHALQEEAARLTELLADADSARALGELAARHGCSTALLGVDGRLLAGRPPEDPTAKGIVCPFRKAAAGAPAWAEYDGADGAFQRTFYIPLPPPSAAAPAEPKAVLAATFRSPRSGLDGLWFLAGALLSMAGVALAMSWEARAMRQAVGTLSWNVERLASGEATGGLYGPETEPLAPVAASVERLHKSLRARLESAEAKVDELESILASMGEGVLAIALDGSIITLNANAAAMLAIPSGTPMENFWGAVRNPELHAMVDGLLHGGPGPAESKLRVHDGPRLRHLHAKASRIESAHGRPIGVVVIISDVTAIERAETMRRDFVANVSHEIRTPLTAIKAAVETLHDGNVAKADARRFLKMIASHSERLDNLVADILALARIEDDVDANRLRLHPSPVRPALAAAIEVCRHKAAESGVELVLHCPDNLWAMMAPPLIEQAVINLVDNAVKHSEPGSAVLVRGAADGADAALSVRDSGCGIAPEHHDRIFERFYRVDKARSRKIGGTGLGLSIVKHIVAAHRGSVAVKSAPGAGSTFTIRLPLAKAP